MAVVTRRALGEAFAGVGDALLLDLRALRVAQEPSGRFIRLLPRKHAHAYDAEMLGRFADAFECLRSTVYASDHVEPDCTAEELVLGAILRTAENLVPGDERHRNEISHMYDEFFQDCDFEMLYDPQCDGVEDPRTALGHHLGVANLRIGDWFKSFDNVPPRAHND